VKFPPAGIPSCALDVRVRVISTNAFSNLLGAFRDMAPLFGRFVTAIHLLSVTRTVIWNILSWNFPGHSLCTYAYKLRSSPLFSWHSAVRTCSRTGAYFAAGSPASFLPRLVHFYCGVAVDMVCRSYRAPSPSRDLP